MVMSPIENVVASKVDVLTNESIVLSSMKTGPMVGLTFSWLAGDKRSGVSKLRSVPDNFPTNNLQDRLLQVNL